MGESSGSLRRWLATVILSLGGLMLVLPVSVVQAVVTDQTKTYYESYPGKVNSSTGLNEGDARYDLLGAAQRFLVFTHDYIGTGSSSGNVATEHFSSQNGLSWNDNGTTSDLTDGILPNYIGAMSQFTANISTNDADTTKARVIFGSGVQVKQSATNDSETLVSSGGINDQKVDNPADIGVDKTANGYIDFTYEFNHLQHLSEEFKAQKTSAGVVTEDNHGDINSKTYDVSKAQATYPIMVTKVGINKQHEESRLSGVQFELYKKIDENGANDLDTNFKDLNVTLTTGSDGEARYEASAPGTYAVVETQGVTGYQVDTSPHFVTAAHRDATYVQMSAEEAFGSNSTGTASQLTIKGVQSDLNSDDGNPGPIIINVDCSNYVAGKNYKYPNLILEDQDGKALADENRRVIWNDYNVPVASKEDTQSNFPNATEGEPLLILGNDTIPGTVLAPAADVVLNGAHLSGMIAANRVFMHDSDAYREPLDFQLFSINNDVTVSNTTYAQQAKSLKIIKQWESLTGYAPTTGQAYPDVKATITAKDSDESVATITDVLNAGSNYTQTNRLPVYAPISSGEPNDGVKPTNLLHDWVVWFDKTINAGLSLPEQTWLSGLAADPDKPLTYSVAESIDTSTSSPPGMDAYQPTSTTDDAKSTVTLTNTQYGIGAAKYGLDDPKTPLDATFTIYNSKNESVGTLKPTSSTATDQVLPLAPGTYTIKETASPENYQQDTKSYQFTLDDKGHWTDANGQAISTTKPAEKTNGFYVTSDNSEKSNRLEFVQYDKPLWKIKIHKQDDASHAGVEGATFKLTNRDDSLTTANGGDAATKRDVVADANYTLSETGTPDAYAPLTGTADISINAEGSDATVKLNNGFTGTYDVDAKNHSINFTVDERKKGTLPSTGGTGILHPLEFSIALFFAAAVMFAIAWWQKRKAGEAA